MRGRILPREQLSGLPKTVHGGQAWKLEDVEDYSHNLNPFGPPDDLAEIIASAVGFFLYDNHILFYLISYMYYQDILLNLNHNQ